MAYENADFAPVAVLATETEEQAPALGYWQDAWIRLKKDKVAMLGLMVILFLLLLAIPYRHRTNGR